MASGYSWTASLRTLQGPGFARNGENTEFGEWVAATTQDGFIAWHDQCTHFCCVPKFKANPNSAKFGAEDKVYCNCHQSVYDPFSIVEEQFVALPRPD